MAGLDFARVYVHVRWDTVLFPFEQSTLMRLLPENGYILSSEGPEQGTLGPPVQITGVVGKKGALSLVLDSGKPSLLIDGTDLQAVISEITAIETVIKTRFHFDSSTHASFYEFLGQGLWWTEKDAIRMLASAATPLSLESWSPKASFDDHKPVNVALRIVPYMGEAQSDVWWEFFVEPSFQSPHSCYVIRVVFRNRERSKVIDFAKNAEAVVTDLVHFIEQQEMK